jgi:uncharacterized membrane protein YbaN (DUF454 family)
MIKDALLTMALFNPFSINTEKWKKEIIEKWKDSRNLPRKKKKAVRKKLQLDWSIACFDPFDTFTIN